MEKLSFVHLVKSIGLLSVQGSWLSTRIGRPLLLWAQDSPTRARSYVLLLILLQWIREFLWPEEL